MEESGRRREEAEEDAGRGGGGKGRPLIPSRLPFVEDKEGLPDRVWTLCKLYACLDDVLRWNVVARQTRSDWMLGVLSIRFAIALAHRLARPARPAVMRLRCGTLQEVKQ